MRLVLEYRQYKVLKRLIDIYEAVDRVAIANAKVESLHDEGGTVEWTIKSSQIAFEIPDE